MEELYKVSLKGDVAKLTGLLAGNPQLPLNAKFTSYQRTPLHIAAMCGHIKFAEKLLSIDRDLATETDSRGLTPLHLASARQSLSMVMKLLENNEDVCMVQDKEGRTPLHLAAMKDRVDIIKKLLEKKPQAINLRVKCQNETILHLCVKHNSLNALEKLVWYLSESENMDAISVNSRNDEGNTIFHLAAKERKMKCIQYLLETKEIEIETDALNGNDKKALDLLTEIERDNFEIGCYNMTSQAKESKKWTMERVNALMVVATLIAGITFQAAMNPPGGIFQDDATIKATEKPVIFTYYLRAVYGTHMSRYLDSYLSFLTKRPILVFSHMAAPQYTSQQKMPTNISSANFVIDLLQEAYKYNFPNYTSSNSPGIVLDHNKWNTIISKYERANPRFFSPYLIRYAGTPILAYRYPGLYRIYMVSNATAFVVSLSLIILVISGFIYEGYISQQVRVLAGMMIFSISAWFLCYLTVFITMSPPFYTNNNLLALVFFISYCILWIGVWLGMDLFQYCRKLYYQWQVPSWRVSVSTSGLGFSKKPIFVDQFKKEDSPSFADTEGVSIKIVLMLCSLVFVGVFVLHYLYGTTS
ncbi:hypothetical protein MKW92_049153 [Papaver armeniacum]|nr:hypothetical protein MKW92_049153 [Papaver armeniacum]